MTLFETAQTAAVPQYCWRRSWTRPYESLWSLLHKFALFNWISVREAVAFFARPGLPAPSPSAPSNLNSLGSIDPLLLSKVLGLSLNEIDHSLVASILPAREIAWFTPVDTLRYCPECIEQGYHSIFHQVQWIPRCPIHDIDLQQKCPQCGRPVTYGHLGNSHTEPYTCQVCGSRLWNPGSRSWEQSLIPIDSKERQVLDDLYTWFRRMPTPVELTDMERWERRSQLFAYRGRLEHKKTIIQLRGTEIPGYWGDLVNRRPPNAIPLQQKNGTTHAQARFGAASPHHPDRDRAYLYRLQHQYPVTKRNVSLTPLDGPSDLVTIYKSIRRHIAKVFLAGGHRWCAKVAGKDPYLRLRRPGCSKAYAYLYWRDYWEVRYRDTSRLSGPIWRDPVLQFNRPWGQLSDWMSARIFALECYWTFQECVLLAKARYASGSGRLDGLWDPASIRGRMLPYWAIVGTDPEHPVIHWWARRSISDQALRTVWSSSIHRQAVRRSISGLGFFSTPV